MRLSRSLFARIWLEAFSRAVWRTVSRTVSDDASVCPDLRHSNKRCAVAPKDVPGIVATRQFRWIRIGKAVAAQRRIDPSLWQEGSAKRQVGQRPASNLAAVESRHKKSQDRPQPPPDKVDGNAFLPHQPGAGLRPRIVGDDRQPTRPCGATNARAVNRLQSLEEE